jgi:hypothetical protein
LVSLSLGCAMVIRFVCDSKYMKAFIFMHISNIHFYPQKKVIYILCDPRLFLVG